MLNIDYTIEQNSKVTTKLSVGPLNDEGRIVYKLDFVLDLLKCHNVLSSYKGDREHIKPDKATYVTLWYLANTEIFRQIPDQFGISKSTAHGVITTVVNFLVSQSRNYIIWPAGSKRIQTINKFKEKSGIHGIVVAIDGSHIQIKKPQTRHSHVYYNRNGYYSILLQAECDYDKKFIDVFCGEAGSMHDCRLLKKSSLYERGNSGMLGDDFLSGDSAYPSLDWLVPPFKDNGNLSQNQKDFNYRYSSTRIVIEHTFGILKGRFRRPRFFENDDILLVKCVIAATVLNNMCIMFNDTLDKCDMDMDNINNDQDNEQFVVSGVTRREYIFNIMD